MFNPSYPNAPPNNQPMMRAIMKRPEYIPSTCMDLLGHSSRTPVEPLPTPQTVVGVDRKIAFNLKNMYCENMISTNFVLSPYVCIMNINTIMARTRNCIKAVEATANVRPRHLEVNKNAVLLHDIEPRWHEVEGDSAILLTPNNRYSHKVYDDAELNFAALHREAQQQFNNFNWWQQKWDTFWMQILLQHIVCYFKNSWSELTLHQRHQLSAVVEQNKGRFTVFDQLTWIGYDCIVRSNNKNLDNINRTIQTMTGAPSSVTIEDLAVDFALNFNYTKDVIDACDKHFEKCPRRRMPYTKMFNKN